jgi:Bardet-Biedl syndrome 7 protein
MRDKYQSTLTNNSELSSLQSFHINDKFELCKDDASYNLSLETDVPIDNILLQCDVPIDLLDTDKNSCVMSHSDSSEQDGNFLLVTFRCQINTTRLTIKVRTIEGQYGLLKAYVTSRIHPKNCLVKQFIIKPLSLHQRCHVIDENRPINKLKLKGNFSMAEMHSWIFYCIPEIPEKPPAENEAVFYFMNTFLGTQLEVIYKQGEATFRSENVSTISIIKDVISKKATEKKVNLDINFEMAQESTSYTLRCIHPMIDYHMVLAKKYHLIDALKELSLNENGTSFLTPEYKEILENSEKYVEEYKRSPSHLERLYGMITDLYIDKFKFTGQNVKNKVPQLIEKLDNYDLEELMQFFHTN